jgi:hypothetical protein
MKTLTGTYYKGRLKLDKPIKTERPIKVTISFEENEKSGLKLTDFSFLETQELLKDCNTSFSDEIIEERRKAV